MWSNFFFAPRLSSGSCILVADAMLCWAVDAARGCQRPIARGLSASSDDTNESCLDVMQRAVTKDWFTTSYDQNVLRFHSHGWGRCPFLRSTFDSLLATARIPCICLQGFQTTSSLAAGVVTHLDSIVERMISYRMSWLVDLMFCNMLCFKRKVVGCLMWFRFTVRFMLRNSYSPFNGERTPTAEAVHPHQCGNYECFKLFFFNLLI